MSLASVTSTRRTTWPLMSRPRIALAFSAASSASLASLTPPALPRPPVVTCAFTTTARPPRGPAGRVSTAAPAGRVESVTSQPRRRHVSPAPRVPVPMLRAPASSLRAVGVDMTPVAPVADASPAPGSRPYRQRVDPGRVLAVASVAPALAAAAWLLGTYPLAYAGHATPLLAVPAFAVVA